jgi:hypothetical protein
VRARVSLAVVVAALAVVCSPGAAQALSLLPGSEGFSVEARTEAGGVAGQAGEHPYTLTARVNFAQDGSGPYTDGDVRGLHLDLPQGLLLNPAVAGRCSAGQFARPRISPFEESASGESCPIESQVGVVQVRSSLGATRTFGVFNLVPTPGAVAQLGFSPFGRPIVLTSRIHGSEGEYNLSLDAEELTQQFDLYGLTLTLWGNPWLVTHDDERGNCLNEADPAAHFGTEAQLESEPPSPAHPYVPGTCSIGDPKSLPPSAYLTLPPVCTPMAFGLTATSWQQPGTIARGFETPALQGCGLSPFEPAPLVQLNTERASSPSGLTFSLLIDQLRLLANYTPAGRLLPKVRAPSPPKRATVTLPEGVTINPSVGAGLGVCTAAEYGAETVSSPPGAGCPNDSKIGDFTVESPLFAQPVDGALFLAAPHENPFGSLIAVYLVAKHPERGILIKVSGRLQADPLSGRLTATFNNLPQLPYSDLRVHFREGQRSPLATPPSCGSFPTETEFLAWREPGLVSRGSGAVPITSGAGGGPCPSGPAPFAPGAEGGTVNPKAGAYSPFYLHLTRSDTEQEITSYSATLPQGLLGNISAIPYCSDAAIAAAAQRSGIAEREGPSCPRASLIGHTSAGYGVGGVLTYAPGNLYLAGPYRGSSFSVVAIDSALVGPFDLGVIVVRSAIRINPTTAQASIDATGTDPIPHIIDGIPIHLRDVRVYIDRPDFILNPTSCAASTLTSALNGSGARFSDPGDDSLATATVPFQAFDCGSLDFRPKIALKTTGGSRRGRHPSLRVTVKPRPGDANIGSAQVTLPPSLFLDQSQIETICTGVQFAAHNCPPRSVYGHVRAVTPLLGVPLEGPVYLRSSHHTLPDLVFVLKGQGIEIDLAGRIDSVNGGIRGSFETIPDAPISAFKLTMDGGKHGILINAANLCAKPQAATARLIGQNNHGLISHPRLHPQCPKHRANRKPSRTSSASASEVSQSGGVRVSFDGSLAPRSLPRHGTRPVRASVGAKIIPLSGRTQPQLRKIEIAINRNGHFAPQRIPLCRVEQIQPATTASALAACRQSLVGEGTFSAKVLLPEQAPFPSSGKVYAFNGRWHGHPAVLAHVYGTRPIPVSYTLPFELLPRRGTYGTLLRASLPEITGNSGYITGLSLSFGQGAKARGYVTAGCPAPAGLSSGSFPFAHVAFSFAGNRKVDSTLIRMCKARG